MYTDSFNIAKQSEELDFDFEVHYGIIEYLANYDPNEAWRVRGISGRDGSSQDYFKYREEKIKKLKQKLDRSKELQANLDDFLEECFTLFNAFRNQNQEIIKQYIDKEFYFILGPSRTGGTFMLKEMSQAVDWPYEELFLSILHNHMPDFNVDHPHTISWRKPKNYYYLLFQIVQFLVYINREVPQKKKVVKKTRFSKCMQLVDYMFGEQAHYIVTIRHPAAINASRMETGAAGEVVDDIIKEGKRTLYFWQTVYKELVRDGVPKGEIRPVLFGPEMDQFLERFFNLHGGGQPDKCRITKRSYNYQFWKSDYVINSMEWVELFWRFHELEFPIPKKIL